MKLYLDDVRTSPMDGTPWVTVQSYEDAINILDAFWDDVTEISLDHDLGTTKTGYDVLCYIEASAHQRNTLPFFIWIHTENPVGQKKMVKVVKALCGKFPKSGKS